MEEQRSTLPPVLFLVGWGLYLVAEAARTGSIANPYCASTDVYDERLCDGYSAAAAWNIFGTVASLIAACFSHCNREDVRDFLFHLSLFFQGASLTCQFGGQSSAYVSLSTLTDQERTLMHGYSVAAAFFFLAAASAVVSALMARRRQSKRWSALLWFFVYMALFAVGYLAIYAAQSASHCYGSSQTYDDMEAEADSTICHGFAFAAIVAAMGVLTGFYFAFLCYRSREDLAKIWVGWFSWSGLLYFATAVASATDAEVHCKYAYNSRLCDGYSAGSFFNFLAVIIAFVGLVLSCKRVKEMKHMTFMLAWTMFFLAHSSMLGGLAAYNCSGSGIISTIECKGFSAGTFFSLCGVVCTATGSYYTIGNTKEPTAPHELVDEVVEYSDAFPNLT